MAESHEFLTRSHIPPADLIERAKQIERIENFFVGLPDSGLSLPRNVLMFYSGRQELAPPHETSHQRYLLVFSLETEFMMLLDGLLVRLCPGQALLMFPFQMHRFVLPESRLFISFELPGTRLLHTLRNRPVDVHQDLWPYIRRLMADYRDAWLKQAGGGEVAALLAFVLLRLERASQVASPPPAPQLGDPAHRIVQRAVHYIATHLQDVDLAVPDIAAEAMVSEGHLQACFRRVLGTPVTKYVRQTRAHLACSLLNRTESSIAQIAERCGFRSISSFSRAFRQEIGAPPLRYRKHLWESRNVL